MCSTGDPLQDLASALDALARVEPSALADTDAIVELHRRSDQLEAVLSRACASFERRGDWAAEGAKSAAAWLTVRCRTPQTTAKRRVALGRALPALPVVERAWVAGDIGSSAVGLLAGARTEATAPAMAEHEPVLVDHARRLPPRPFARVVAYWRQAVDADGVEDEAARLHAQRRVHLSSSFEGRWFLEGVLDPIGGEIVSNAIGSVERELFASDWAEARARCGDATGVEDLVRTPAQRRADALVELARRATRPRKGSPARPLFTVHVGYETLAGRVCELASRTIVSPGALVPWLDEADVERVVFDGPDRVMGVGAKRRFFTGADRRAVEVRDRECTSASCDVPAERCEVDHVVPFGEGGPTVAENGRLACGFHNRSRPGAGGPPGGAEPARPPP
jgi:hypothetical protein